MVTIFFNRDTGRMRAGWRLVLQFFFWIFIMACGVFGFHLISSIPIIPEWGMTIVQTAAVLLSVWIMSVVVDHEAFRSFGLQLSQKIWWRELALGLVFGAIAMTAIYLTENWAGWVHTEGWGWNRFDQGSFLLRFMGYLGIMILVGFEEELMFRGYQLKTLCQGLNSPKLAKIVIGGLAVIISSVIFGLMHSLNPNASWVSTINIMGAGVMLALPYLVTGRLGLSIGMHITWNFFEGGIYGFAVSGMPFRFSVFQVQQHGPGIWTGGAFGPEAGIMGLFGILLLIGGEYLYLSRANTDKTAGLLAGGNP